MIACSALEHANPRAEHLKATGWHARWLIAGFLGKRRIHLMMVNEVSLAMFAELSARGSKHPE